MQAQETRAGGRHAAAERGAFEPEPESKVQQKPKSAATAPLIDFLNIRSLMELQRYFNDAHA
jgi:hypothetical protein